MEKTTDFLPAILLAALIGSVVLLAGCTGSSGGAPQGGYGQYGNRSGFGNMTADQRQAMMQQMAAACQGMALGNNCTIQSQRGNRPGTCQTMNSTLICIGQYGGYNRTASG